MRKKWIVKLVGGYTFGLRQEHIDGLYTVGGPIRSCKRCRNVLAEGGSIGDEQEPTDRNISKFKFSIQGLDPDWLRGSPEVASMNEVKTFGRMMG
jgi:hypothetical protein